MALAVRRWALPRDMPILPFPNAPYCPGSA
jgi:hypothetical protein